MTTFGLIILFIFTILFYVIACSDRDWGRSEHYGRNHEKPKNWGYFEKFIGWGKMSQTKKETIGWVLTVLIFITMFTTAGWISISHTNYSVQNTTDFMDLDPRGGA